MAIKSFQLGTTGLAAVVPSIIYINTDDTVATVTTAGYLNSIKSEGFQFAPTQMALVVTENAGVATCGFYNVVLSGDNVSLVAI